MAAVGLALSVAQTLFSALQSSPNLVEICSKFGYLAELEDLKGTVSTIRAVLLDVDDKQLDLSHEAKDWINKLKDALYDVDDALDEFDTITLQQKEMTRGKIFKKVQRFFSRSNPLLFAFKTSQEIKKIKKKLDAIARDRTNFGLGSIDSQSIWKKREETCSHVRPDRIVGRESDEEKLVGMLLDADVRDDVSFVSIVGIGGLGKTTLAQLVYDHVSIKSEFQLRLWACVSQEFGVKEILSKMMKSLADDNSDGLALDQLQRKVRQSIETQKYLLVLDDVWEESHEAWEKLKDFLIGGRKGSKVLVTTRSKNVARAIGNIYPMYELKGLSEEHSWQLFKLMAFDREEQYIDASLVEIGKDIVEKCSNVPLSIRVIGSLLYGHNREKWLLFQRNDMAKIQEAKDITMAILKFSYCHLTPPLKSCFSYCALFPKDYLMGKTMLIHLWVANGCVVPQCEGQRVEDVGEEYFSILLQRCFFQDLKEDVNRPGIFTCKVHDFMHDLALEVAGHELQVMSSMTSSLDRQIRHLYVPEGCSVLSSPQNIPTSAKTIRTFLHIQRRHRICEINAQGILSNCRRLRWLDLIGVLWTTLPSGIGGLIHLRCLSLSINRELERLPESITNLRNLQILILSDCSKLRALPKHFSRLVNLRLLNIRNCHAITQMPRGMKNLTCLERLSMFVVGGDLEEVQMSQLEDLKALPNLRGGLHIKVVKFCSNDTSKVKEGAYLLNKPHLKQLNVEFERDDGSGGDAQEALLEALRPNSNLTHLKVKGYEGMKLASWVLQENRISLSHLVEMWLSDLPKVEHLPPLSHLFNLKRLLVDNIPNLEYMESDGERSDASSRWAEKEYSTFFPALERLDLHKLPKIKGWWRDGVLVHQPGSGPDSDGTGNDDDVDDRTGCGNSSLILFPSLRKLDIRSCPNMKSFPPCPHVKYLWLNDMNEVPLFVENRAGVDNQGRVNDLGTNGSTIGDETASIARAQDTPRVIQIQKPPVFVLTGLSTDDARLALGLPSESVRSLFWLTIEASEESLSSWASGEVFRRCASSLQFLDIQNPKNLMSLLGGGLEHLSSLRNLGIINGELEEDVEEPWKSLHNLSSLTLVNLSKLVNLPKGMQYMTSLQSLTIGNCGNLRGLPEWLTSLTSLRSVTIDYCRNLTYSETKRVLPSHTRLRFDD